MNEHYAYQYFVKTGELNATIIKDLHDLYHGHKYTKKMREGMRGSYNGGSANSQHVIRAITKLLAKLK